VASLKFASNKDSIKMVEMRATLQGGNWSGPGHAETEWSLKKYIIRKTVDLKLT
jgi:hypothetical protein